MPFMILFHMPVQFSCTSQPVVLQHHTTSVALGFKIILIQSRANMHSTNVPGQSTMHSVDVANPGTKAAWGSAMAPVD